MIGFQLSEAAKVLRGELIGNDAFFSAIDTDTRKMQPGKLFVALSGENFDGHDYLDVAASNGAVGALVAREVETELPIIRVNDTLQSLGTLASVWRKKSSAKIIAVTGSNGKTTLKEMIAAILSQQNEVLATRGNFNNDIGLPLTLARLQDETFAVIEMGANHQGEISYLSKITQPDIAILNNAGRAHLEGFGSLEGVARAKAEILDGLNDEGIFVFNADDAFANLWRELSVGKQVLSFGVQAQADIYSPEESYQIEWQEEGFVARFEVVTPDDEFEVKIQLAGEHNRLNALAAITACHALGVTKQDMIEGFAGLAPVPGRLCPLVSQQGARLIDDSYNANPDSVLAALQVLRAAPGYQTLVLGDLGELGAGQIELHAELGRQADALGIHRLLSCGDLSGYANDEFAGESLHFSDQKALIDFLQNRLNEQDTVLVKGSRAAAMDRVIKALRKEDVTC